MLRPFLLLLALAVLFFGSCTASSEQAPAAKPTADADSLARAKEIYKRDCLVCHGANGDGKTGIAADRDLALPDWTDPKSLAGRSDQLLFQIIRSGRGKMPAESAGRADDGEIRDLIRYIRALVKEPHITAF